MLRVIPGNFKLQILQLAAPYVKQFVSKARSSSSSSSSSEENSPLEIQNIGQVSIPGLRVLIPTEPSNNTTFTKYGLI